MANLNALNLGSIVLPGDNYPSIHGFNIPVTLGLEGAYLFGDGVGQMSRNYAPGKKNATLVGTPVAGIGYGTFSETGYLDTGITETADMTIVLVCRDSSGFSDAQPGFAGNHLNLAAGGVAIIHTNSGTMLSGQAIKAAASDFANVPANLPTFTMVVHRAKNLALSQINNLTTGASANSTQTTARVVDALTPIWIGRIPSNSFRGLNDQVAALIFSRAITDVEMALLASWLRGYCSSKGITV